VARTAGPGRVQEQWRRIWQGYASFAYFIEAPLVKSLIQRGLDRPAPPPAAVPVTLEVAEAAETALVI